MAAGFKSNMDFISRLKQKNTILVFDGAMGTALQFQELTKEEFGGSQFEGCNEYLLITKPKSVEKVHRSYLEAGCDVIETNTFGANSIVLAEYGLEDLAYELNLKASNLAKSLSQEYSSLTKPLINFVIFSESFSPLLMRFAPSSKAR